MSIPMLPLQLCGRGIRHARVAPALSVCLAKPRCQFKSLQQIAESQAC